MSKHTVLSPLHRNGKPIEAGTEIDLRDEAEIAALILNGTISEAIEIAAPKEPKEPKPSKDGK